MTEHEAEAEDLRTTDYFNAAVAVAQESGGGYREACAFLARLLARRERGYSPAMLYDRWPAGKRAGATEEGNTE